MTQFTMGADASCSDGICGEVSRVVVDPVVRAVTHLVVEPKHRSALGRLVPLDLVDTTGGEVRLSCTRAEFEELERAEVADFLPGTRAFDGYDSEALLAWPLYGLGAGNATLPVVYDRVPLGEVAVRRGERVHATDGAIGGVQGLVIDPGDRHVTHVLLQEGHLWGRKDVAIPIRSVTRIDGGIQVNLTKQDVQDLPAVDIDHPAW